MKKTMVCVLTLSLLCAALLSGCGETTNNRNDTTGNTIGEALETMMPDVNDGIVEDNNGTAGGNGTENGRTNGSTVGTVAPKR